MSEPVFHGMSIREHAGQVAESVRAINHLSLPWVVGESTPYPCDVADRAARACLLLSVSAAAATGRLATALDEAEQHLSCLAYAEQPTPSTRTATPDTTPTAADSIDLPGLGR